MKKLVIVLLAFAAIAFAQSDDDRTGPYIAVGGGYAVFNDDHRMDAEPLGVNPSYNLNIIGGAFLNQYFSVEISYDYYDTFVNDQNENTTKLYVLDVAAKAHYPFWKDRIDLYAAFGAGQVYWKEKLDGVSQEDKSGVLRGDAGVGFRALDWLTINIGYRRYFFTLDQEADGTIPSHSYFMDLSSAYTNIEVQF